MSRGQIAQLVEHAIENRSVAGSIPALATTLQISCDIRSQDLFRFYVRF